MITPGYYRHYKGGVYQVLFTAKDSETLEEKVIYRGVDGQHWARPVEMWNEQVNGIPRFKLLDRRREGWRQFELAKKAHYEAQRQKKEEV